MHNKFSSSPLSRDHLQAIGDIIRQSLGETFRTLFHVDLNCDELRQHGKVPADAFICRANLSQEDRKISLFFSFDKLLLRVLLEDIYPAELLQDPMVYSDAASEIANIVGNNVKKYLNEHGFHLLLDIPYVEKQMPPKEECVHLHFSLENAHLYVDMIADSAAIA